MSDWTRKRLGKRFGTWRLSGAYIVFGHARVHATLFGLGLKSEVMGVALPKLSHTEELVVDCYKPGVLL